MSGFHGVGKEQRDSIDYRFARALVLLDMLVNPEPTGDEADMERCRQAARDFLAQEANRG